MLIQKKIINRLSAFVLSFAGASLLLGCASQEAVETKNPTNTEKIETEDSPIVDQDGSKEKLIVDAHRCIGCGKCARVAPKNFEMKNRKAVVISKKKSSATTQAIKICPVSAIST